MPMCMAPLSWLHSKACVHGEWPHPAALPGPPCAAPPSLTLASCRVRASAWSVAGGAAIDVFFARVCSFSSVCRTLTLNLTLDAQTQGFAWVDDTTSYNTHRWGWASEHVGDVLKLQVRSLPHLRRALPVVQRAHPATVILGRISFDPIPTTEEHASCVILKCMHGLRLAILGFVQMIMINNTCTHHMHTQVLLCTDDMCAFSLSLNLMMPAWYTQVDTTILGRPSGAEMWLSVAVLMSYQHMGTAVFVRPPCETACACLEQLV